VPKWKGRSVHDIERKHVRELVEEIAEDRPVMANRALAYLSKFFNWCCERDILKASPCVGVKRPAKEQARERVLTDDEIKALWKACETIGYPAGPAVQLLLLTGQRRTEVFEMRRSEITGDLWTIPGERVKNKREHAIPLTAQAMAIIEAAPVIGDYVFSAGSGNYRLGSMSHSKDKFDAIMRPKTPWTLHDIRRTVATGLQRLGVRLEVTESVLNHKSGSFRGIVSVYQKHQYGAEKRDALGRWADYVEALVSGRKARVVALRR
jgi:integrase